MVLRIAPFSSKLLLRRAGAAGHVWYLYDFQAKIYVDMSVFWYVFTNSIYIYIFDMYIPIYIYIYYFTHICITNVFFAAFYSATATVACRGVTRVSPCRQQSTSLAWKILSRQRWPWHQFSNHHGGNYTHWVQHEIAELLGGVFGQLLLVHLSIWSEIIRANLQNGTRIFVSLPLALAVCRDCMHVPHLLCGDWMRLGYTYLLSQYTSIYPAIPSYTQDTSRYLQDWKAVAAWLGFMVGSKHVPGPATTMPSLQSSRTKTAMW